MNLGRLIRQLRREVAAHPQKAAALGLMLAVALYLWGPLVWKGLSTTMMARTGQADMAALILTDDPVEQPQVQGRASRPTFRWEKIRPLLAEEGLHRPARWEPSWVDPFAISAGPAASPEPSEGEPSRPAAPEPATLDVGKMFVLSSILIGPRRRLATINGDTFAEGDVVPALGPAADAAGLTFRVVRIFRDGVELEAARQRWVLKLPVPSLAQGDDWTRGGQDAPR